MISLALIILFLISIVLIGVFINLLIGYNELFFKVNYFFFIWIILFSIIYTSIEKILFFFTTIINDFVVIKDFQDIIVVYMHVTFFITNLLSSMYFIFLSFTWQKQSKTKTELFAFKLMFLLVIYSILVSLWIVKQDLFLANWDVFLNKQTRLFFDIQPDFTIFFFNFIDDFFDFFFFYFSILVLIKMFFASQNQHSTKLENIGLRILVFAIIYLFLAYFFMLETWGTILLYFLFAFIFIELLFFTRLFLIELKKIILIKGKNTF